MPRPWLDYVSRSFQQSKQGEEASQVDSRDSQHEDSLGQEFTRVSFPGRAETPQKRAVLSKCMDALSDVKGLNDSFSVEVDDLSELDRQILVEKHLISPELSQVEEGSGIVLSEDRNCCIMINEEDHLRIQVLRPGLDFGSVWKVADALDTGIESAISYAYDGELGFLTACPTNLGTGMRASAMMHLPGLVMSKNMDKVINAVNQLGIAVRGLFGEGSDANGSIFQISNQQTLGESETAIIDRLDNTLKNIVRQENFAREKTTSGRRREVDGQNEPCNRHFENMLPYPKFRGNGLSFPRQVGKRLRHVA